jgi:simple sugar transport system permease protein
MNLREKQHEILLAVVVCGFSLFVGLTNGAFFTLDNLFDLLRSSIVIGILAIGVFVVLASGGIDVSFAAIATFCFYATTKLLLLLGGDGSIFMAFIFSSCLGLFLGLVNAVFVSFLRLPTLIVTLGTLSLFRGVMLTFVGSDYITVLPAGMVAFSRLDLFQGVSSAGVIYRLPAVFLVLPAIALLTSLILNRTIWGRGVLAMGGSHESAIRSGFPTKTLQFFVYGYVGVLSGIAGLVHATLSRMANPFDLSGIELNVIAAVVLGGARITGGYGSVGGTLLGVGLIVVINNSLILLGLPSYWQKVAVGILILVGTGLTAVQSRRRRGVLSWSS